MERFSLGDAAELAGDVGPDPRLIGVLAELDRPIALAALRELIAERLPAQPILARRVVRNGPATWNASWQRVDVRVEDHVFEVRTSDPLATATRLAGEDLGHEVPAWRLILLSGPDASALLFAAHHVLPDGATAVTLVGSLLGADFTLPDLPRPRRGPLGFLGLLAGVNAGVGKTSLLTPITEGFRLVGRNEVAAMAVAIPASDGRDDAAQLVRLAGRARWRKLLAHGFPSAGAFAGVLALLGRLGWYRPLFSRQRAITSLLTNLRGPAEPLRLLGAEVTSLTALSPSLGNVTVVFAAVSYAGTLRVTARLDRSVWPEQKVLTDALDAVLQRLSSA